MAPDAGFATGVEAAGIVEIALALRPRAAAARDVSVDSGNADILERIAAYEAKLEEKPLSERTGEKAGLSIVRYNDELAGAFYDLNAEWIRSMFAMEKADEDVLSEPRKHIIAKGGDILVAIDGKKIASMDDLRSTLDAHEPGDEVTFEVVRGGKTIDVTVVLGRQPATAS